MIGEDTVAARAGDQYERGSPQPLAAVLRGQMHTEATLGANASQSSSLLAPSSTCC